MTLLTALAVSVRGDSRGCIVNLRTLLDGTTRDSRPSIVSRPASCDISAACRQACDQENLLGPDQTQEARD